jgi:hypothetical protein
VKQKAVYSLSGFVAVVDDSAQQQQQQQQQPATVVAQLEAALTSVGMY